VSPLFGGSNSTDAAAAAGSASANRGTEAAGQQGGAVAGFSSLTTARPEIILAAAFAAGVALAILARRLGR
jgi:hypothetical protein